MGSLIAIADAIDRVLRAVALLAVWVMPLLALVICVDVVTRKLGIFLPVLTSSRLQELEWHLHTVLFALWLGFAYVVNAHPRVDSWSGKQPLRKRAWLELIGCLLFALPYCVLLVRYAIPFVWTSYSGREGPFTVGGIPYPWIIKSFLLLGLALLLAAVVSMILRLVAFLFGGRADARLPLDGPTASV